MKNIMKKMLLLAVAATLSFVSCQKQNAATTTDTLDVKLANDQVFKNVLSAASDLGVQLDVQSLSDENNITELRAIAARINAKTATTADYTRLEQITGVSYDHFIGLLQNFGVALNELNKKFPQLSSMKQADLTATFTKAIQSNTDLQNMLVNPAGVTERLSACPLRDLCNLAVSLTRMFAGDAICTAISVSTIPVIGGLLCTLILNLGVSVLTAICNALPC